MGRREVVEIGGLGGVSSPSPFVRLGSDGVVVMVGTFVFLPAKVVDVDVIGRGRPDIIGGGNSNPSAALRLSCRAKSDACHHSRNFSAKIEVGRTNLRLDSSRGYIVRGWNIDVVPGSAPDGNDLGVSFKAAMAR